MFSQRNPGGGPEGLSIRIGERTNSSICSAGTQTRIVRVNASRSSWS